MDKQFKVYTRAVILSKDKKRLLLIKKNNHQKIGAGAWMLPGGTLEWGENTGESLVREIKEETNLDVSSLSLVTERKMLIGDTHWVGLYFLGSVEDISTLHNNEQDKHEEISFVPVDLLPYFVDYPIYLFISHLSSNTEYFNNFQISAANHSMGKYLNEYVDMKMHHILTDYLNDIRNVIVVPIYDRGTLVSKKEKNDKLFNYKRPTTFYENGTLYLTCFPIADYILHYSMLVDNYLDRHSPETKVSYYLPGEDATFKAVENTITGDIPKSDIVVYGNVDKLPMLSDVKWMKRGEVSFYEYKRNIGKSILFIGCEYSVWGNAATSFLRATHKHTQCHTFIYVGKLGTFIDTIIPNTRIAVMDESNVNGETVHWKNIFGTQSDAFVSGKHYTLPSVMQESNAFVRSVAGKYAFVDPEVGHFAKEANSLGIRFSQLHIVSDNVKKIHEENLSNERKSDVVKKRESLWELIEKELLQLVE
ncbi:MAG: NUDIX hydrolase [Minisyncoccota bacterium]